MKISTIKTPCAIILLWDEKKKTPRKIMFGDPRELRDLWSNLGPIVHAQIQELCKKEYDSPEEMRDALDLIDFGGEIHTKEAMGSDMWLQVSWELVKKE